VAQGLSWRRILESLSPAKACGQYRQLRPGQIEADKAGYEEGILLDQRGMVCEGTGENLFLVKDGVSATPGLHVGHPSAASTALSGDPDRPRTSGTRSSSATSPRRALPRRRDLHDRHGGVLTPIWRSTNHPSGSGQPGRVTRGQAVFEDALHGRAERYASGSTWSGPPRRVSAVVVLRLHPARRMQGEGMSLSRERGRVAHVSTTSASVIEAGFPRRTPRKPSFRPARAGAARGVAASG
jgi:hypothetical protein